MSGTGNVTGASMAAKLLGSDMRSHVAGSMTPVNNQCRHSGSLRARDGGDPPDAEADRSDPVRQHALVQSVRAHWRVLLPKLALISPTVAGSLETTGSADGPLQSLTADVQVRPRLRCVERRLASIEANLTGRVDCPPAPSAVVQASGNL